MHYQAADARHDALALAVLVGGLLMLMGLLRLGVLVKASPGQAM